jgi:hypothetical protein
MRTLLASLLATSLVGCLGDDRIPADDDADPTPPADVTGTVGPIATEADPTVSDPPPAPAIGLDHASVYQQRRMLEAALGVDADFAVIATDILVDNFHHCPSTEHVADGVILHGGCTTSFGRRVEGTASIRGGVYAFADFDVHDDQIWRANGTVTRGGAADRPSLVADLHLTRSFGDEAVEVASLGTWRNDGHGTIWGLPTPLFLKNRIGVIGVGGYSVFSGQLLHLADPAHPHGAIGTEGDSRVQATLAAGDTCWSVAIDGAEPVAVCDLWPHITLDPR